MQWSRRDYQRIRALINAPDPWGRTLYVRSTHIRASDSGSGLDPSAPLATLAQAMTNAVAGDQVIVGAGHVETIVSAAQLDVTLDNISVLGLGKGSQRPKITVTTIVGAFARVSGDGVLMSNLVLDGGFDAITKLLHVTGDDFHGVELAVTQSTGQPVNAILLTTADRAKIIGLEAEQNAAGATSCIDCVGGNEIEIAGCRIRGDYSASCVENSATAMVAADIGRNKLDNLNAVDVCIDMVATSKGWIHRNWCRIATDAQTTWIDPGDCAMFENYGVNNDGETGKLIGTASI